MRISKSPVAMILALAPTAFGIQAARAGTACTQVSGKPHANLILSQPYTPQTQQFVVNGEVQAEAILQCGDGDADNFFNKTPAADFVNNLTFIAPTPGKNLQAVLGYWIVPSPNTKTNQLPVPANPSAPAMGQWVPIAYSTSLFLNEIGITNPTQFMNSMIEVNKAANFQEPNKQTLGLSGLPPSGYTAPVPPTRTGTLMVDNFIHLFDNANTRAYVMPAEFGSGSLKSYNVYMALTVCQAFQPSSVASSNQGGTNGASNAEAWEVLEALTGSQITTGASPTLSGTFTGGYMNTLEGYDPSNPPAGTVDVNYVASAVKFTGGQADGNALYDLGKQLEAGAGFKNSAFADDQTTRTAEIAAETSLDSGALNGLETQLWNIYRAFNDPTKQVANCANVPVVSAGEGTARWFEVFPAQFTCSWLDRLAPNQGKNPWAPVNTFTGGTGFLADYEAAFDKTTGKVKPGSVVNRDPAGTAPAPPSGGYIANGPIDRVAADLMSAGALQMAQNLAHTKLKTTAPTVSCFKASPYINNVLQWTTIPVLKQLSGTGAATTATLMFQNPAPSQHPEPLFALDTYPNVYMKTSTIDPVTFGNIGDTKAVFGLNNSYPTAPISLSNMGFSFTPGSDARNLSAAPIVPLDLDRTFGLIFTYRIRGLNKRGTPGGCGSNAPYCAVPSDPYYNPFPLLESLPAVRGKPPTS